MLMMVPPCRRLSRAPPFFSPPPGCTEECALEVDAIHAVKILFLQLQKIGGMDDAGIVDENINGAKRLFRLRHQMGHIGSAADIAAHEQHLMIVIRQALAASGPFFSSTSAMMTRAPSATKRSTMARPMPCAAPVTMADLPDSFMLHVLVAVARNLSRQWQKASPVARKGRM